jgi:hypothetical protein
MEVIPQRIYQPAGKRRTSWSGNTTVLYHSAFLPGTWQKSRHRDIKRAGIPDTSAERTIQKRKMEIRVTLVVAHAGHSTHAAHTRGHATGAACGLGGLGGGDHIVDPEDHDRCFCG